MIGLALVATMSIVGASAKASVDESIAKNFVGDLVISNLIGQGFSPSVSDKAEKAPGVESVVRTRYAQASVAGRREFLGGVDPAHFGDVMRLSTTGGGLADVDDGACLMNEDYAKKHGYGRGDLVPWQMPNGNEALRVVGTYDSNGAMFATCVTNLATFSAAGFQSQDNVVFVTVKPGVDVTAVEAALNQQIAALPTVTVKNQREYAAEQREPIDRLVLMIYALLGMAIVIALLGVVNTLALSVIERTREIGLLRAIGLSRAPAAPDDRAGVDRDRRARCAAGRRDGCDLRGGADVLAARRRSHRDPHPGGVPDRVRAFRRGGGGGHRGAPRAPCRTSRCADGDRHRVDTRP